MEPIVHSLLIDAPPALVYDFLADLANHPSFCDHYLTDWHLTRKDSVGLGAGVRFRVKAPFARFAWGDVTITAAERPRLLVEEGRMGKANRVVLQATYELRPGPEGTTRLTYAVRTFPRLPSDRLVEALGGRLWLRRQIVKALFRLRALLEEGARQGGKVVTVKRITVAGG